MPQLQRYDNDGLELFIDQADGSVWASQSALGRIIDKQPVYVSRHEKASSKGVTNYPTKTAETLTPGGIQGVTLYGEDFIFSLFQKYKPELLVQCAKAGLRVYLYGVAGYEVKAQPKPKPYPVESLPPADIRIKDLITSLEKLGLQPDNPRFQSAIADFSMDLLMGANAKRLPAENEAVWQGVVERAVELGYSTALVTKYRSQLGRHVSKSANVSSDINRRQESRLCNGTYREIYIYEVNDALDAAILGYFSNVTPESIV